MSVVVQKYGGSSVADVEKIRKVAAAGRRHATTPARTSCVVVSAMGDTTDELLALAKKISPAPPRRELDMLLTAGERISMALLSMALHDLGRRRDQLHGQPVGHHHQRRAHVDARIVEVRPTRVQDELARGKVVIVAGFQGVSPRKEVTTLGRGGSDTTAVALAAALGGDCEIYSDVEGVFTADPRVVPDARRLDALSYDEMQELAQAGAKVLNAQAVEFAKEKGIAIHARSTFGGAEETVVRGGTHPERIAGIATQKELALLGFPPAARGRARAARGTRRGRGGDRDARRAGRRRARARQRARLGRSSRARLLAEVPGLSSRRTRGSARCRWWGPASPPATACCAR